MKQMAMTLPLSMQGVEPSPRLVFPIGEPPQNDDRKWRFTAADFQKVAANFAKRTEAMPWYVAHGDDPSWGKKAAAWVDSVAVAPEGFVVNVRWTAKAKQEIRDGHWGYVSPGFEGEEDAEGFIHPVALNEVSLVNDPAIGGMVPVAASTSKTAPPNGAGKETQMATDPNVNAAKTKAGTFDGASILQLIRDQFKIPDVIDDASLTELVSKAIAGGGADKPENEMPPAGADQLPPALTALTERIEKQEKETAALKQTREIETVIEAGVRELKLTPALVPTANLIARHGGVEALKTYVASLAVTAPAPGSVIPPAGSGNAGPEAIAPYDFIGRHAAAFDPDRFRVHKAAIAFMDKQVAAGLKPVYREAVVAVTAKIA